MELKSLAIFIEVAELNSFTKAGEKLGYSQPTISFQIKQLEEELGVKLFDRIGHTITLTEPGREILKRGQMICRMYQEMITETKKEYEIEGIVNLGMADSLCIPLIEDYFGDFRRSYPKLSLKVRTGGTDELFRLLNYNEVDMVCTLDEHIYDPNYIVVNEERIGVNFIVSAKHPLADREEVSLEELLTYPFLLTEQGMSYRRLLERKMAEYKKELRPILEIGSADLICELVEKGYGISFLPDYVTKKRKEKGKLVYLKVKSFEIELWKQILYHRNKWLSLQMQAVIHHFGSIMLQK